MVDAKSGSPQIKQTRAVFAPPRSKRAAFQRQTTSYAWQGSPFEAYARKFVKSNFWRVRELLGAEEDAMQECALIFLHCLRLYENSINNPAWLMALYKRALHTQWHTKATKDARYRSIPVPEEIEQLDFNQGYLGAALAEASDEVRQVIAVIANAPTELLASLFSDDLDFHSQDATIIKRSENALNRRFRRMLGISNATTDIVSELRAILG